MYILDSGLGKQKANMDDAFINLKYDRFGRCLSLDCQKGGFQTLSAIGEQPACIALFAAV